MGTVEQKIRNIETGLVEFTPGPQDSAQPPKKASLSERMAHYKVPGVSIAIINDGTIEWAKGYGVINAASGTPVTTETIFEAASTTKLLTSAIALRFVERGLLDLDEDVNAYFKSWKIPENEFTREHKVTLRLLLMHRSGLPASNFDWQDGTVPTLIQFLEGEAPAQNQAAAVEYVPGSKWQYSNLGYVVIQLLLEDVSGQPYTEIVRRTVFDPLGMASSTLAYPLAAELQAREAVPHDAEGIARQPGMVPNALAHGGLMTTPPDLARLAIELMRAYRGQSDRIWSQEMVRRMFGPELDLPGWPFPIQEGLGVFLRERGQDFSFLHPGANLPGATCWVEGCPISGKGAVIMTNGAKGDLLSIEILGAIEAEYNWPRGQ